MTNVQELKVKIVSASGPLYDGKATAVSGFNKVGPFDILPMHENFISLISDKVIVHDGDDLEFKFERGLLEVTGNVVSVFVGI
ncbi:MAG: hypothetical protein NUV69_05830 [Candidatus Curtissbacteria bacterium]|nr:hypothetical protein [Candidatus Curtissbacteria bacterium]